MISVWYCAYKAAERQAQPPAEAYGGGKRYGERHELVFKNAPIQPVGWSALFGGTPTSPTPASHHIASNSARGYTHQARQPTLSARHESVRDPPLTATRP
jgi:hypothetical protein